MKKKFQVCVAAALGAGLPCASALEPHPVVDPSRPSSQQPVLPERSPDKTDKALTLPGKPPARPEKDAEAEGSILLKRVIFEGNHAVSSGELETVAKPYLNRRVTGGDLEELRYRLTLLYVDKGYVNSGAIIPEQQVEDGDLRIKIIEGRLTEMKITDVTDKASPYRLWPLRDSYIRDRLAGDPEKPLNTNELRQRYLMLLNDRMIERLNGSLLPGLHPGDAVLDLKVTRARPYGSYLGVDNFSPPQIGGTAGRLGFWVDNLTTFGERIDFNMAPTGGAFSYNTGIDIPLTAAGTRFAFRYTNAETVLVEPPFDVLNIVNNVISYDGQLSHPVIWDLSQKLTLGMNFGVRQNTTLVDGSPDPFSPTRDGTTQVTVLRTWQDYLRQGKDFDLALRSTFSVGFDALGATVIPDSPIGSGQFFAWLGQGIGRYRFLSNGAYVSLSSAVQATGNHLLALERIAIGGFSTVRGFRQNYLVRDEGFFASAELGYPLYGGEPGSQHSLFLIPFMDYGGAWDKGGEATYLHSAGIGMEWRYSSLRAGFFWAGRISNYEHPQGAPWDAQDNGINFEVSWRAN